MNSLARPSIQSERSDAILAEIVEEVTNKFHAGEAVEVEWYVQAHPEFADQLRQLLPALQVLAGLGQSVVSGDKVAILPIDARPAELGELGDFRLVREVGRGGMGVVYEAVQMSLNRRVALKVLPFAAAFDPKQLQRFKNEAQAAAQLHHTNIVPVHYVGCERGVHFYAMQYIEGQTLAAVIAEQRRNVEGRMPNDERMTNGRSPSPKDGAQAANVPTDLRHSTLGILSSFGIGHSSFFRTVASLGQQAAQGLEHAHQVGVVHRDIKPANLLVDGRGNVWVTDFGLAHVQSNPGLTLSGDLLGTLRYMSPEQALAKRATLDARTDVYSLGVTLYELLTLAPAYNGRNREEILRQIAFEEPRPPSRLNQAVPAELETIVLKAMAKSPEERYSTAQELAEDLGRFLEDKPIRAKRPSLRQRAAKWMRRHKTVMRAAGVVLLLAVAALAVSTALIWRAYADLSQSLQRERQDSYRQRIALAEREWSANNLGRMEQLLDACPADLRGWEWRYLKRLPVGGLPALHHTASVMSVTFSPDDRWIVAGGQDGAVTVWDATTGSKQLTFRAHQRHIGAVTFRPDGRLLATCSWDKKVKVWDFGRLLADPAHASPLVIDHDDQVDNVAFSPDSQRVASSVRDGSVQVWDLVTRQAVFEPLHVLRGNCIRGLAYSPDGNYLAAASVDEEDRTVSIWNARTGQRERILAGHHGALDNVDSVTFSPDSRWLASTTSNYLTLADGEIKLWDVRTGKELRTFRGHTGGIWRAIFSPDGQRLASAGWDETVKLWDVQTGQEVLTLRGHQGALRGLSFSRDGTRLVSGGADRTVRVWDARPLGNQRGQESLTLNHGVPVRSLAFSPDGQWLASVTGDGAVRLWDFQRGHTGGADAPLRTLDGYRGVFMKVLFSHGGRFLVAGGGNHLKVWDTTTWMEQPVPPPGGAPFAYSPDGKYLATCKQFPGFVIEIRDAATGRPVCPPLRDHDWAIWDMAFSPASGGPRLASASHDGSVRIWNVKTGTQVIDPPLRHTNGVRCVAFSKDGRFLASGGEDHVVKVWDTQTWKLFDELPDLTTTVRCLAFHPKESSVLAWGGTDSTVRVWKIGTKEIHTLHGHTSWVQSVAFSPDGEWLASASLDGTVKIWKTPSL